MNHLAQFIADVDFQCAFQTKVAFVGECRISERNLTKVSGLKCDPARIAFDFIVIEHDFSIWRQTLIFPPYVDKVDRR